MSMRIFKFNKSFGGFTLQVDSEPIISFQGYALKIVANNAYGTIEVDSIGGRQINVNNDLVQIDGVAVTGTASAIADQLREFLFTQVHSLATGAAAVIPSDTTDLPSIAKRLLVGTAGNGKVTMLNGDVITLPLQQGYNPLMIKRVWATGTTASNIFALY